jgi:hypothetical protein
MTTENFVMSESFIKNRHDLIVSSIKKYFEIK